MSTQIKGGGIKSFDLVCNYDFSWNTSVIIIIVTPDKESLSLDLKVCSKTKILVQQKKWSDFFSRNRCGWDGCGWCGAGAGAVGSPTAPRGMVISQYL